MFNTFGLILAKKSEQTGFIHLWCVWVWAYQQTEDSRKSKELLLSSTFATFTNSVADASDCLIFTSGTFAVGTGLDTSVFETP